MYIPALEEIVETLVESPEPKSIHVFSVLCWEKGQGMAHVSVSISFDHLQITSFFFTEGGAATSNPDPNKDNCTLLNKTSDNPYCEQ